MANTIQVTPAQLRSKAEELRSQNSQLKTQIEALRNQEAALGGMWEGEAHDTFRQQFLNDCSKMDAFYTAIEAYAATLESIAANYESAEGRNTSTAATRSY